MAPESMAGAVGEDEVECCLAFSLKELMESAPEPAEVKFGEKLVVEADTSEGSLVIEVVPEVVEEAAAAYIPAYPDDDPYGYPVMDEVVDWNCKLIFLINHSRLVFSVKIECTWL